MSTGKLMLEIPLSFLRFSCRQSLHTTSQCSVVTAMRYKKKHDPRLLRQALDGTDVPVIRVPQTVARRMEAALSVKKAKDEEQRRRKMFTKNLPLIISCKRAEYNYRPGVRAEYKDRFKDPKLNLATHAWANPKSKGDWIVIRPFGDNPAFRDCDLDPVPGFQKFSLHEEVRDAIADMNFTVCTNIQNDAIPMLLQGDNVLMAAETGSGKTLAYLIPLINKLVLTLEEETSSPTFNRSRVRLNSPRAVILVPSRELAQQVFEVVVKLIAYSQVNAQVVIGGERTQMKLWKPEFQTVDVLVATPGVLSKLLSNGLWNFRRAQTIVVDEADSLLDDSFSTVVKRILQKTSIQSGAPGQEDTKDEHTMGCQLILSGATLPRALDSILEGIVNRQNLTRVTTRHLHRLSPHIKQTFHRLLKSQKSTQILELVRESLQRGDTLMVFCNDAATCDWLAVFLEQNGVDSALNLNGQMMQRFRRGRFDAFKNGTVRCLVCTDIVSRGLDTTFVNHVINYDFPTVISDYIHRCGRTGRVGTVNEKSRVTSFISNPQEVAIMHKIEEAVRNSREYENVNANISRKINAKQGITPADLL